MSLGDRRSFELIVHERWPELPWLTPAPKLCGRCGAELTADNRVKHPRRQRDNGECLGCHEARKSTPRAPTTGGRDG